VFVWFGQSILGGFCAFSKLDALHFCTRNSDAQTHRTEGHRSFVILAPAPEHHVCQDWAQAASGTIDRWTSLPCLIIFGIFRRREGVKMIARYINAACKAVRADRLYEGSLRSKQACPRTFIFRIMLVMYKSGESEAHEVVRCSSDLSARVPMQISVTRRSL
jgi:hypothetical protein